MAKYNMYAIAVGNNPKTNKPVFNLKFPTWDECKPYVVGVNGAKYKGFLTEDEADAWLKKKTEERLNCTEQVVEEKLDTAIESNPLLFSVSMSKEFRDICVKYRVSPKELTEYLMNKFVQEQNFLENSSTELPWS